jgi:hypothetical protein
MIRLWNGGIRRFDLRLRVQGASGFKAESGSTDYSSPVARFTLKQMTARCGSGALDA